MKAVPGVGYPSVHCGLTASRVRSRAHLLKSGEKMTRLNMQMNTFPLTLKDRFNVNVAYTLVSCSPCCDGRLCTRAFCTWVRSKADLKENGESFQALVVSRHAAPTFLNSPSSSTDNSDEVLPVRYCINLSFFRRSAGSMPVRG